MDFPAARTGFPAASTCADYCLEMLSSCLDTVNKLRKQMSRYVYIHIVALRSDQERDWKNVELKGRSVE